MEVPMDLAPVLGSNLARLDSMRMKQLQHPIVYKAIDQFGQLSAQALNVRQPLTSCERVINNPSHTLYLMWEKEDENSHVSKIVGMLKVGRKHLFFFDKSMQTYHGQTLCVLDFYVHYSRQRQGIGKHLFDFMLSSERVQAGELALDSPSVTMLAFMAKHYGLSDPIWQNTNFVVFQEFFQIASQKAGDNAATIDGWTRTNTPKAISGGPQANRWLSELGRDSDSLEAKAHSAAWGADLSTEGTIGQRTQAAKQNKAWILSSKPLW